mmetsp:Transcript_12561/g.27764  ORF Transcript_12561/g.27764 Transcript_12561/m.27764 type:complete len:806 (-) Transcript_12561:440-2857(-)
MTDEGDECIDALGMMEMGSIRLSLNSLNSTGMMKSMRLGQVPNGSSLLSLMRLWEADNEHVELKEPSYKIPEITRDLETSETIFGTDIEMKDGDFLHKGNQNRASNMLDNGRTLLPKESLNISSVHRNYLRHDLSFEERQVITMTLRSCFLMHDLSIDEASEFLLLMHRICVSSGSKIIQQGASGEYIYIIQHGRVSYYVNGKHTGHGSPGDHFGQLALIHDHPRAATVVADDDTILWSLGRVAFRSMLARAESNKRKLVLSLIKRIKIFEEMSVQQQFKLSSIARFVGVETGVKIVRKGYFQNELYMIKSGSLMLSDMSNENDVKYLCAGDYFGESSLLTDGYTANKNVSVLSPSHLFVISRVDFNDMFGSFASIKCINENVRNISTIPLFAKLKDSERSAILSLMRITSFKEGEHIIKQGDIGDSFYVIIKGSATVTFQRISGGSPRIVRRLQSGDFFGEMSLLKKQPRSCSVVSGSISGENFCDCLVLDAVTFHRVAGSVHSRSLINRAIEDNSKNSPDFSMQSNLLDIPISRLKFVNEIGKGSFSCTYLVQDTQNFNVYALKSISRNLVSNEKKQMCIMSEKTSLLLCNHPFINKLHATFKDKNCLYFLLEYGPGGEFTWVLENSSGCIPEAYARFYAVCLCLVLEHLSFKNIAHRDIKPENIVFTADGYIKVIDFGLSKVIVDKSFTVCGTPEYLAPEIILGKGHDCGVDHWAFGILLFHMCSGIPLFCQTNEQHRMSEVYENIVSSAPISFPDGFYPNAKILVEKLLMKDPVRRLGMTRGGFQDIWNETWFDGEYIKTK